MSRNILTLLKTKGLAPSLPTYASKTTVLESQLKTLSLFSVGRHRAETNNKLSSLPFNTKGNYILLANTSTNVNASCRSLLLSKRQFHNTPTSKIWWNSNRGGNFNSFNNPFLGGGGFSTFLGIAVGACVFTIVLMILPFFLVYVILPLIFLCLLRNLYLNWKFKQILKYVNKSQIYMPLRVARYFPVRNFFKLEQNALNDIFQQPNMRGFPFSGGKFSINSFNFPYNDASVNKTSSAINERLKKSCDSIQKFMEYRIKEFFTKNECSAANYFFKETYRDEFLRSNGLKFSIDDFSINNRDNNGTRLPFFKQGINLLYKFNCFRMESLLYITENDGNTIPIAKIDLYIDMNPARNRGDNGNVTYYSDNIEVPFCITLTNLKTGKVFYILTPGDSGTFLLF
ncbi:Mrx9p SCDLUD_004067 [Saccharomycodes ludwigii]|uniref:Mrx9p n=1 Tax=Saccharomycodes ludwigii TaxID=36035 RepID=UPI001E880CD4|nr:hypothetical protein SCDLUD_004067 [Saccharomycodes ludwigii]KAH3899777.1 hypothetical protein SCDLUD_004067 [Saccharomycodes ludwigii]